ncbi:hypothetical protein P22_0210 [Propionispora sp. 2/2-37]|uniref:16S rRNA (uracil(1498)-N(3))-methyltransferase n=1 Tax=Propionispora sp. 2/2-37 TaxID=1677858 RepID=UPI0006BB908D|nr:16S rRNA (uracil(1498)-N(3))-methyltransferase [Propionispora sp. 2/2-37]CUH94148.1 hypothetical protein P22_0210 [Propionispora sp. 2/2-37]
MRRFFLNAALAANMVIEGSDVDHICRVLRMKSGDKIIVVDYKGKAGIAEIQQVTVTSVTLKLKEQLAEDREPDIKVCLVQGLPKGDKMDYIVQKAVELGVDRIIPMISKHVVVRYDDQKKAQRVIRWQKIAVEASKQCGRFCVPTVEPIQDMSEIMKKTAGGSEVLVLYEGEQGQGLKQVLLSQQVLSYTLIVGPEGGFAPEEISGWQQKKASIVTLGSRILRTETASLAAVSIVMYECGNLGG